MKINMRLFQRTNGNWYVEFGRGKTRSLKTTDKGEAKRLFAAVRAEYLAGRLSEIRGESTVTLGDFRAEYDKWARSVREQKTYKADMLALSKLVDIVGEGTRLDKITLKHADMMIAACKDRRNKPGTINAYIRHLRAVFNKVVEWKYLPASPFRNLAELPKEQKAPQFIPASDVTAFLANIANIDERRILTAYIYTGRRRAELLRLEWRHVDMDRQEYFVERSKAHLSKWYPMHPMFKAVLEAIGRGDGRVFSRWAHPDSVTDIGTRAFKAAKMPGMTLHKLRHTFATLLMDQGVDLRTIGALLGHTDMKATEIYAHVTDNRQREALRMVNAGPVDLSGQKKS